MLHPPLLCDALSPGELASPGLQNASIISLNLTSTAFPHIRNTAPRKRDFIKQYSNTRNGKIEYALAFPKHEKCILSIYEINSLIARENKLMN